MKIDPVASKDPEHVILSALIQAHIETPRAQLSKQVIAEVLRRFDPSRPVWPHAGSGYAGSRAERRKRG